MSTAAVVVAKGAFCGADGSTISTRSASVIFCAADRAVLDQPLDELAPDHARGADDEDFQGLLSNCGRARSQDSRETPS